MNENKQMSKKTERERRNDLIFVLFFSRNIYQGNGGLVKWYTKKEQNQRKNNTTKQTENLIFIRFKVILRNHFSIVYST